jgi:hypothetical protein
MWYTNSELFQREMKKTILFTKNKNTLRYKFNEGGKWTPQWNVRSRAKEIDEDSNKWKDVK